MNPNELRASIPALEEVVYLNTGASAPLPRPVAEAVQSCVTEQGYRAPTEEGMYTYAFEVYDEARRAAAGLLGADESEVALTQSTTDGINRIACASEWEAGDVIVTTDVEHSAGELPWRRLADLHGVEVRIVETDRGRLDPDDVADVVDEDVRLVSLSATEWAYGCRLPVEAVTELAHDVGARVLVDAVQAVGARPVDVESWGADFVAAAGHKWLLGPWGAGFLYVREGAEDWLTPRQIGYRSVEDANTADYEYKPGAQRLEVATTNPAPYAGLVEAIERAQADGVDVRMERIAALTGYLKSRIPDEKLLSPPSFHSGLVTVEVDDPEGTVERLDEQGVKVRVIPSIDCVRVSVHAFNTRADLDRFVEGAGLTA
ncbi:aminotransferase class V-fold PLP-dependent enzyme [Salinigranum halophilum]|jgi:selenocysteine lyase/cysteine desulfurase|uniref:aminotransferase class V-fold PLP-dependent enzyme n=1 Tax=Salinigranum halophilum TaxID=2565931 RepID=UPI0010A84CB2|nr:aminotransferase class V-fold PLP-dependent enzyme [Salinigranum halophilum]